ncbi:MAG: hypothetical protein KKF74_02850 [Nanoarchaeota archaeon]|nr:hypothetical protein [Nanoarchaeota archaeon]
MKDVTKKLKNNPNLNIDGLIDYLLDDNGFSEDEKEIKNQLDKLISIGRKGYEFVEIGFRNNKGEHKFIKTYCNKYMLRTGGVSNTRMIKEKIKKVKDYFEDKTFDGIDYKGFDLEVEMRHMD